MDKKYRVRLASRAYVRTDTYVTASSPEEAGELAKIKETLDWIVPDAPEANDIDVELIEEG